MKKLFQLAKFIANSLLLAKIPFDFSADLFPVENPTKPSLGNRVAKQGCNCLVLQCFGQMMMGGKDED